MRTSADTPHLVAALTRKLELGFLSFAIAIAVGACGSSSGTLYEPQRATTIKLAAEKATLRIVDDRTKHIRRLNVPFMTMPGQGQGSDMAVPLAAANAMLGRVVTLLGARANTLHFDVTVVEALGGWSSNWTSENEIARVLLAIDVRRQPEGRVLVHGYGQSWAKNGGADTSEAEIQRLFEKTFVDAFDRFLLYDPNLRMINDALRVETPSVDVSSPSVTSSAL